MNKRFKLSEDIHKGIKGRYPLGSPLHQHTVPVKVAYHPLTLLVQPKCYTHDVWCVATVKKRYKSKCMGQFFEGQQTIYNIKQ